MIPGEYILAEESITANDGRETVELMVANTGDRPRYRSDRTSTFLR